MKKAILALSLSIFSASSFAMNLQCSGTEPFWGLKVEGKKMTFSSIESDKDTVLAVTRTAQAAGYADNNIIVIKSKFTSLTAVRGECSDGMSDETYSHHAVYEKGGVVFGGCCNLK